MDGVFQDMRYTKPMQLIQPPLLPIGQVRLYNVPFPSTRFQGSKRKLTEWIWANVAELTFDTVLDVFGGTGAVSHLFKTAGKQVTYNDNLAFNWNIGLALIQNSEIQLTSSDVSLILEPQPGIKYPDFIQRTFAEIYFTDEENVWLDRVVYNIDHMLTDPIKQAIARFALYQACIIKRPYNLFHRANLYMRMADVERSFGNKATWDTPFDTHFRFFVEEANASVFDNGQLNYALRRDALETPTGADLVYIDPPYLNKKGVGVDYLDFYHFLEGLTCYDQWPERIDYRTKHKRLLRQDSPWNRAEGILDAFEAVIKRHQESILVVSYRDNGIPSKSQLLQLLRQYKRNVREAEKSQKYALAIEASKELLLIAT
jgi:adenine-specific DNA methylase